MPSHMESSIEYMVFRFHRFAGGKFYLTKEDLGVLIEKESPGFLENQKDSQAVDRTMKWPGSVLRWPSGRSEFFALVPAHRGVRWRCAHEAEGKVRSTEQGPVSSPQASPQDPCPAAALMRIWWADWDPLVQVNSHPPFNKRKKSQVNTEKLLIFILFASSCPQ